MDTARQILRFSIPGSIFLLHGVICYLLFRRIQGVSFVDASTPIRDNIAAVFAVVATIPVGFVIYQIYYFNYVPILRVWPFRWCGRYVRRDRGGQILRELDPEQICKLEEIFKCKVESEEIHSVVPSSKSPLRKLMHATGLLEVSGRIKNLPMEEKKRQHAYELVWSTHWNVIRAAVDIAASHSGSEHVKTEYTTLSDIYHSLGAARTAVLTAWLCTVGISVSHFDRVLDAPRDALLGGALISIMTMAIYMILHTARGRTSQTATASLVFALRWLYWRHGDNLGQLEK